MSYSINPKETEGALSDGYLLFITHNDDGFPSIRIDPQIAIESQITPYLKELHYGEKLTFEILQSGNITIILNANEKPLYTMFAPTCTKREFDEWFVRCGSRIECEPWKFEMGKGATITKLGHFQEEEFAQFNHINDYLDGASSLSGWAEGVRKIT